MAGIAQNVAELVGRTPMVYLSRVTDKAVGRVAVKVEFLSPGGSVKDRIAVGMLKQAETQGLVDEETIIVESTSGNMGISLAFACAALGRRLMLTMPETLQTDRPERVALLRTMGADLVLTPASEGMRGATRKAQELVATLANAWMPDPFRNQANAAVHRETTAVEIWDDTQGAVDVFVAGCGTGGTLTGVAEGLKAKKPGVKVVAVEPAESPVLSGGKAGAHKIAGIGPGFVPAVLRRELVDEVLTVSTEQAYDMSRRLMREEGLVAGVSSGANVFAAVKVAQRPESEGKLIVTILCDLADRYAHGALFQ